MNPTDPTPIGTSTQVRPPDGFAYRYPDPFGRAESVIAFTGGADRNGSQPIEAVPYWLGTLPDHTAAIAERDTRIGELERERDELKSALANSFCDLREEVLTLTTKLTAALAEVERMRTALEEVRAYLNLNDQDGQMICARVAAALVPAGGAAIGGKT